MRRFEALATLALALLLAPVSPVRAEDDPSLPPPVRPGSDERPSTGVRPAQPSTLSAAASDYRLSAGDVIEVTVLVPFEARDQSPLREPKQVVVVPGGRLSLPKLGEIRLDGRTLGEVEAEIEGLLKSRGITSEGDAAVNLVETAPRYVFVVGGAFAQIRLSPFGRTTLLQVFARAGDAMREVDASRVTILSAGGTQRTVDLAQVIAAGASGTLGDVGPGDTIVVQKERPKEEPIVPRVYILGYVKMPGAYVQADPRTRKPVTLLQLIAYAGGFTEYADASDITIRRFDGSAAHPTRVDVRRILKNDAADVPLVAGDIVYVND